MFGDKNKVAGLLALGALLLLAAVLVITAFVAIPQNNKEAFNVAEMAVAGIAGTAFGFYLGGVAKEPKPASPEPPVTP